MSDFTLGFLGAVAGLLIAALGNLVLLPYVLRQQEARFAADSKMPILGWDKEKIARVTKLMYRIQMPLVFALVGAVFAVQMFGGTE